ncbi:chemotaxis protein CheB [Paraburkholderia phenoliruptrix]|uniref:chemotaxis protein CheB n=1 Tax=Paraburkholderia phenoliruptrix TaxID=252970 RepID=UPI001C6EDD3A|nr:chemotaxis protein CheB [Paraburkholderia phenoliruptrix]MBW9107397.1 PAS domain-containing protein [Paraburkholderia phenoliruptrix]MBW9128181.1 PAS domain-containing protein [Paraburkholderia ginsengiterrae]
MTRALTEQAGVRHAGPAFAVVGIGASAGGVQALLRFFEAVPPSPGVAFVVVLHLSPDHISHAHDVIQHVTGLPVRQVTAPVPLERDHVYVIPPGKQLSMVDGYLRLREPEAPRFPPTSIDVFFRSLAEAHGARAVSIILSGSGSDGAIGIARVREQGGITIAQQPEEAQYQDMPRSAIATGNVDFILPVAEIAPRLLALVQNAQRIELPAPSDDGEEVSDSDMPAKRGDPVDDVLDVLRQRTRHDFSNYKRGTILRRIERRLQVNRLTTVDAYRGFLNDNVEETPKLLADLLIGVTNFFRDPEAFEALENAINAELIRLLQGRDEVRAWVPACATGEEAFSIAILLSEAARKLPHRPQVTVFATDIDEHAIAVARTGSYPRAISNDVTPARLAQFFNPDGDRYRLVKSVRDTVIFAPHNILRDPPFSRMDLVSCRNMLIYLDRRAQSRVLETLHFSLRPGGYLFLGSAESADFATELFAPVDKHKKIYKALPHTAKSSVLAFPVLPARELTAEPVFFNIADRTPVIESVLSTLTRAPEPFGPPVVVVRADGLIVQRSANAIHLIHDHRGARITNLFDIVREDARPALRQRIEEIVRTGKRGEQAAVPFETSAGTVSVDLLIRPLRAPSDEHPLLRLICDVVTLPPVSGNELSDANHETTVDSLRRALAGSEERLRDSMDETQSSAEELRASNEELQAMNEELRSASEELEASREELQSLNEELVTVNAELMAKVDESARTSNDLQNLISLVGVATIFLDRQLNIKRYTAPADTLFSVRPTDLGRPLQHLTHKLDYPAMIEDLRAAFGQLKKTEREVSSRDGRRFLARVLPYRTDDDRIDGAVLALIDITEQKNAEDRARESTEKLKLAAQATHEFAIIVLDQDGMIVSWNLGAARMFGFSPEEMLGQRLDCIFTPEDRAAGVPDGERQRASQTGRAEDERWHVGKDNKRLFCSGFLSRVDVPGFSGFIKIAHDATRRKLAENRQQAVLEKERTQHTEVQRLNRMKDEFIAILSHELKNPLNLIHMKAEMLVRLPEVRHIGPVQEVADAIQKSVNTQAQLIDDLLDFSRVNTGKLSLHFAPTDITGIVRSIADAVGLDAQQAGIRLTLDLPDTPVLIRGDAVRLEQIVWNLVSNALKFTPNGGHIDVRLVPESSRVRLEVSDTGIGIAPEAIGSIFEMFRQEPSALHRARKGGLGIGLSLVQQLVQLHGGSVEAQSAGPGRGSRFVVWLPADSSSSHRHAGDRPGDLSVFRGIRVLLVEDAPDSLAAMSDLFSLYEARVTTSADATTALEVAGGQELDLVITDVTLPDLDGYALVQRLRSLPSCKAIPIIAVTGRPIPLEEKHALEAGCDACLPKPFNLQTVADIFSRLRNGRS